MKHTLGLFSVLSAVWLVWSGHYTSLLLALGLVSIVTVVLVSRRMGVVDEEGAPWGTALRFASYAPYLAWEILKSNLQVARCIVDPRLPIHPLVFRAPASQKSHLGRVIYANSITLTPGTVSLRVDPQSIVVHALTREAADGVLTQEMDRRVSRLERRR